MKYVYIVIGILLYVAFFAILLLPDVFPLPELSQRQMFMGIVLLFATSFTSVARIAHLEEQIWHIKRSLLIIAGIDDAILEDIRKITRSLRWR